MPRADAKLKNLPQDALDELWELKHPSDRETKPLTLQGIAALVPDRYGVSISVSALGEFYQWLEVRRRIDARATTIDAIKEVIAKDTTLTPRQVRDAGQRLFMAEGILERDPKTFAAMAEIEAADTRARQKDAEIALRKDALALARDKLTAATRSKLEAGLDALYVEIKGNAKAEAIFKQLQEVVAKA